MVWQLLSPAASLFLPPFPRFFITRIRSSPSQLEVRSPPWLRQEGIVFGVDAHLRRLSSERLASLLRLCSPRMATVGQQFARPEGQTLLFLYRCPAVGCIALSTAGLRGEVGKQADRQTNEPAGKPATQQTYQTGLRSVCCGLKKRGSISPFSPFIMSATRRGEGESATPRSCGVHSSSTPFIIAILSSVQKTQSGGVPREWAGRPEEPYVASPLSLPPVLPPGIMSCKPRQSPPRSTELPFGKPEGFPLLHEVHCICASH